MPLSARGHARPPGSWWARQDKQALLVRGKACGVRVTAGGAIALVVALGIGTPVVADDLDDRKSALENEVAEVQQSMEYLDADIAQTIGALRTYQDRLPAAQQSLAEAQGRVEAATGDVEALAVRVDLAQEARTRITDELQADQQEMDETREVIGRIATEAYKTGGVPTNVSLLLGSEGGEDFTQSLDLVDQALRGQATAMERLSEQNATNANREARLVAVEAEINRLKDRADAALAAEQAARDTAAAEKAKVDELVAETSALSARLQEQKPAIEAKLASVEQAQQQVTADLAERQRQQIEEARKVEEARRAAEQERVRAAGEAAAAEQARLQADARAKADEEAAREQARLQAEAAAANRPPPAPVQPRVAAPAAPVVPVAPVVPDVPRATPSTPSAFGLSAPVRAPISSGFGWRATPPGTIDFTGTGGYLHSGTDYGVGCGTPLYAAAAGEVWYADSNVLQGAGNRIVLNHGVIGGNALATNYYHLSSYLVSVGQHVTAGQLIGYTGTTGNSTGCHLHFETMLNGTLVDPVGLF